MIHLSYTIYALILDVDVRIKLFLLQNVFSLEKNNEKIFKRCQTASNKFLKPAINATAPFIGMAMAAKSKSPQVGLTTKTIIKSILGGEILS